MVPRGLRVASLVLFYPSQSTKRSCHHDFTTTLLKLLISSLRSFSPSFLTGQSENP